MCIEKRGAGASAMASQTEIGVVYGGAIVQGLALVTFPAASSIFTSPDGFGFDSTRYGTMFVPQVVLAISASALAPRLARRLGLRRVLLAGFASNVLSMTLLAASALLLGAHDIAFGVLLLATAALGFGFGATVMALNTYAEAVFVYGILETLNGNWAILYLSSERGVPARGAAFALAAFWVMVTLGRVAIAMISRLVDARLIYAALPIALFLTFQVAAHVHEETGGIIAFGLAGLACSAFLPLSISFGGREYPELSAV